MKPKRNIKKTKLLKPLLALSFISCALGTTQIINQNRATLNSTKIQSSSISSSGTVKVDASKVIDGENVQGTVTINYNSDRAVIQFLSTDFAVTNGIIKPYVTITDNYTVRIAEFKDGVFGGRSTIAGSLTLPSTTEVIGEYAFSTDKNLTSIYINDCPNLTEIKKHAFSDNPQLKSITINNCQSLTAIRNYAFANCDSLNSIYITDANSLNTIEIEAFSDSPIQNFDLTNCPNFSVVHLGKGGFLSNRGDGTWDGYSEAVGHLAFGDLDFTNTPYTSIPRAFGDGANGITSITLPNTITFVGALSFGWCYGIKDITIHTPWHSLKNIENQGLVTNSTLDHLYLDAEDMFNNTYFSMDEISRIGINLDSKICAKDAEYKYAFNENDSLNGTCSIRKIADDKYTIYDTTNLSGKDLVTNDAITSVEDNAFKNNENISGSITLSSPITSIGANTFDGAVNINRITIKGITDINNIGTNAFANCTNLTELNIPYSLYRQVSIDLLESWGLDLQNTKVTYFND